MVHEPVQRCHSLHVFLAGRRHQRHVGGRAHLRRGEQEIAFDLFAQRMTDGGCRNKSAALRRFAFETEEAQCPSETVAGSTEVTAFRYSSTLPSTGTAAAETLERTAAAIVGSLRIR